MQAIFDGVPQAYGNSGVHVMTGPVFVEDARPGDMLEVRYLAMTPRNNYGSNLAVSWGYLCKESAEKERVTIYELDVRILALRAVPNGPASGFHFGSPLLETSSWSSVHGFHDHLNRAMREASLGCSIS